MGFQAFIGGNYELVNRTTFLPNPDYFAALLWQQLCGNIILSTISGTPPAHGTAQDVGTLNLAYTGGTGDLKVFAMCAHVGSQ